MAKATKQESTNAKSKGKKSKAQAPESAPQKLVQFSKDSWSEYRKIQWPTPRQVTVESIVVLITVIFVIALVNFYDFISNFLLSFILK